MRSVFNKSEYRRLKHRPVKIIQLLMDDIKCCTERITKGYCSKDVDNIDIWFLNIIPDMLQSLMDKKMGVPKEIYDNYENIEKVNKKEKLIQKLKVQSKSFSYEDAKVLLEYLDFLESNKGKTSGSRVVFTNELHGNIMLHKPHSQKELKKYQIKQLKEFLEQEDLI